MKIIIKISEQDLVAINRMENLPTTPEKQGYDLPNDVVVKFPNGEEYSAEGVRHECGGFEPCDGRGAINYPLHKAFRMAVEKLTVL